MEAVCRLLATTPATGQQIATARFAEMRRFVVGDYLIYYLPADDGIRVVRVVHGARDQDKLA